MTFLLLVPDRATAQLDPAERVARVRTLLEELYFAEAQRECEQSLKHGRHDRRQLLELYRLQGLIASATGKPSAATEAFKRLLILGGEAEFGPQTPPRTREAFDRARKWVAAHSKLTVTAHLPRHELTGATMGFGLEVRADPMEMVSDAVLALELGRETHRFVERASNAIRWSIPFALLTPVCGQTLPYRIEVRDENANILLTLRAAQALPAASCEESGPTPRAEHREHATTATTAGAAPRRRMWTWIAATGAVASFGLGIGLRVWAGSINDEWLRDPVALGRSQHDWERLRDSGQAAEVAAYVSFGVGTALALTSAVLFWLEGRDGERGSQRRRSWRGWLPVAGSGPGLSLVETF